MGSIGENRIESILNRARIKYIKEKKFQDLKHGLYRYDFYIPNYCGRAIIIEYNGEQHYHYIKHFHKTRRDWERAKSHDRQKISYALANNIEIYEVPYWELGNLVAIDDVLCERFRAFSRWKNDEDAKLAPPCQKV